MAIPMIRRCGFPQGFLAIGERLPGKTHWRDAEAERIKQLAGHPLSPYFSTGHSGPGSFFIARSPGSSAVLLRKERLVHVKQDAVHKIL